MDKVIKVSNEKDSSNIKGSLLHEASIDMSFKPIHQQIKEDSSKPKVSAKQQKEEIMSELGIDEKLLNILRNNLMGLVYISSWGRFKGRGIRLFSISWINTSRVKDSSSR